MLVIAGSPAVSYYSDQKLYFVRASDTEGGIWGTPSPMALDGNVVTDVGQYNSLALIGGSPAIAYFDGTNFDLKYIRADSGDGTSWLSPNVIVDGTGGVNVGQDCSLAEVNSRPVISYYDAVAISPALAYNTDVNGAGLWTYYAFSAPTAGYAGTAVVSLNNRPAVAYWDGTSSDLRFTAAIDDAWTSWSAPIDAVPDDPGIIGMYPSLQIIGGVPAIAYFRNNICGLGYVTATDNTGMAWNPQQLADLDYPPNCVGMYPSLCVIAGNPAMSYFDDTTKDLKFAIFY